MGVRPDRRELGEWVRVDCFEKQRGVPVQTVKNKRANGEWPEGIMVQIRDRRLHVNLRAYDYYVQTGTTPRAA